MNKIQRLDDIINSYNKKRADLEHMDEDKAHEMGIWLDTDGWDELMKKIENLADRVIDTESYHTIEIDGKTIDIFTDNRDFVVFEVLED